MRALIKVILALCLSSFLLIAVAAEGTVAIISPPDGATLDSEAATHVVYSATFGNAGDHAHLYIDGHDMETVRNRAISRTTETYVDGKWVVVSREINGKQAIDALPPGKHEICIKVVDKAHKPIGIEKCIEVISKTAM